MAVFTALVEPLGRSLPSCSEVVLHDLARLPNSIVAVHGDVTGRSPGDPATDLLLERIASGAGEDIETGYETKLADGRKMRSSTMIVRDADGARVLALCINTDISAWQSVVRVAEMMLGGVRPHEVPDPVIELPAPTGSDEAEEPSQELFVKDLDELAAHLVHRAVRDIAVPVELMKKEHKLQVVRTLKQKGMFMLRDSVQMVATVLGVTRFTIYNYLNEIGDDGDGSAGPAPVAAVRSK
ncbi:hypothetical protein GIS00_24060 [Nakamurella sp. YIM 132087]|uniref:Transcriptional regulator n=1 Tax=Nakamurella alba TaxID=2665158 RepID=A0A7K1FW34_9ACTN|nr:PAS domain-containing protein [Nakamurella alba]MTD17014.1 hypothetical protein [Nakamurella alba]